MAFRAVSAPMLRSEPGTLLETVAGTMTMGTQSSPRLPRAACNSSSDRRACGAEPSDFSVKWGVEAAGSGGGGESRAAEGGRRNECQGKEPCGFYHSGRQWNGQVSLHTNALSTSLSRSDASICKTVIGKTKIVNKQTGQHKTFVKTPKSCIFKVTYFSLVVRVKKCNYNVYG